MDQKGIRLIENLDTTTIETFAASYHGVSWLTYAAANGVTILIVKNLIQNGDMAVDANNNGIADGFSLASGNNTASLSNGLQTVNIGSHTYLGLVHGISTTANTDIYIALNVHSRPSIGGFVFYMPNTNGTTTLTSASGGGTGLFSDTGTVSATPATYIDMYGTSTGTGIPLNWIVLDFMIAFHYSGYTKTQLDAAITFYGYPAYNVIYNWPDVTDPDYQAVYDSYYNMQLYDLFVDVYGSSARTGYAPDVTESDFVRHLNRFRGKYGLQLDDFNPDVDLLRTRYVMTVYDPGDDTYPYYPDKFGPEAIATLKGLLSDPEQIIVQSLKFVANAAGTVVLITGQMWDGTGIWDWFSNMADTWTCDMLLPIVRFVLPNLKNASTDYCDERSMGGGN